MSVVTWVTKTGTLGTIPESQYYSNFLVATDSDNQELFYSLISGQEPTGLYLTRSGELRGIPTLTTIVDQTQVFSFTVRATNPQGVVADRSFSISVTNTTGPNIIIPADLIGAWFDGNFLEYQFTSTNDNPSAETTWKVISGTLPPGVTLSSSGVLSGYVSIIGVNTAELGYEVGPNDSLIYDALPTSTDRYYNFTVEATDGAKFDTHTVRLLIVSKGNFTADNAITLINNTFINIDADNKYRPIIVNDPTSLPTLVAGSTFGYKFVAIDPEEEDVSWSIDELAFSGLDELDAAITQLIFGNGTVGPYTLGTTPQTPSRIVVKIEGVLLTLNTDYTVVGDQLTFVTATPSATEQIEIQYIDVTTGFDTLLFDQGASGLPSGLTIDQHTGWIFGKLPAQIEDLRTYTFRITAFRTLFTTYRSDTVSIDLTVKRTLNEEIVWTTPEDLGTIDNGSVSELAVEAYNTLGKELEYSIVYQNYRRIPQGLKFLPSGRFTGRTTFRYFSLDGSQATLNVVSTSALSVGMQVQGPGIASGCRITAINSSTQIVVKPAIYVDQGTLLTFSDQYVTKVISTTSNAISTAIDGGKTSFDRKCKFTVQASAKDGSITSLKTFFVNIYPYNLAPYENIYLRALPSELQRNQYDSIVTDKNIFTTELIYRPDDPNFGVNRVFKTLFLAGLTPSTAAQFVNSIKYNHYNKVIDFGQLKTAVAKDGSGNIVYEVVYVDAVDNQAYDTEGPPLQIDLTVTNSFIDSNGVSHKTIYPNSFGNMQTRLENSIGYTNRGALPKWMTSVQENGLVLGPIRAVVLAYVKPGAAKLIQYRLNASPKVAKSGNFAFVSDRYQWDNYLSTFYNPLTAQFEPSKETTFDKYVNRIGSGDTLDILAANTAVNSSYIKIPDNTSVGQGWVVVSRDLNSTIPDGTTITSVHGSEIGLSNSVSVTAGAQIRVIGETKVDYAVSCSFDSIDGSLLSYVRESYLIDGVYNFVINETIVFKNQYGFTNEPYDGWVNSDGDVIPGYLDKAAAVSPVNQRGGSWRISWIPLTEVGFDSDEAGFDQTQDGLKNSYFDQGGDNEVYLTFVNEVLLNQQVYIRSGRSYPRSILTYTTGAGTQAVPSFIPLNVTVRTAETTFDGGTCCVREKDVAAGRQGVRGGLSFFTNRDKYVKPESRDKYIKFPQNGVFV